MFSLELFCFVNSIEWIWWFNVAIVVCECVSVCVCVCLCLDGWNLRNIKMLDGDHVKQHNVSDHIQ